MKPQFLYGTAWKKSSTKQCVLDALKAGYRGIDTANQLKHYDEEQVGLAINEAFVTMPIKREDLFLQTKYTFQHGQGDILPYDPKASIKTQVEQSFSKSLEHLHTSSLDSFLLHGPMTQQGLRDEDYEAWETIQSLAAKGLVKEIGVSNMNLAQLKAIYDLGTIKPRYIQNRCFAQLKWDQEVRSFCTDHEIIYQGFSLLTANLKYLGGEFREVDSVQIPKAFFENSQALIRLQDKYKKTIQQLIFRFALDCSMLPLTGTWNFEHMKMNLQIQDFKLSKEDFTLIENIAF